jgi:hypothetical protein
MAFADDNLDIQLQPVCLTHDQCVEYRLPRTPIKQSERRGARFEVRYGQGATEVDAFEALHPGALRHILVREIERFYDRDFPAAWRPAWWLAEVRLGQISAEILSRHADEAADLEERLAALRETAEELRLDIEERNDVIEASCLRRLAASRLTGRRRRKLTSGRIRSSTARAATSIRPITTRCFKKETHAPQEKGAHMTGV